MAKKKNPKEPKKLTKAKIKSMERTAKKKAWAAVAQIVRERDGNVCVVCRQPHSHLNVHHLIPREIKEYWLEPMNLISLCPKHHKFSRTASFHASPLFGYHWMQQNRPDQLKWVMDKIIEMQDFLLKE